MKHNLLGQLQQKSKDVAGWWRQYALHMRNVGSILPSSKYLARTMTSAAVRFGAKDAIVIEAGAGKGAITQVLAKSVLGKRRIVACEYLESFAQALQHRLPDITVACCRVQDLPHWQEDGSKIIVSSLPFRSLPKEEEQQIAQFFQAELCRNPQSVLVQFTYGLRDPIPLLAADPAIRSFRYAQVWRNSPPASVWVYQAT